jgi:hypothetical protein
LAVTGIVAAGALFVFLTLPPRPIRLDATANPNIVAGAYHVHTSRSDGTKPVEEIAAAAARAGLKFVVFTDHGDATRPPDPPAYHHGVLCLDAVEISTDAGHLVALGLDRAAPYPLAGDPEDVIEDVHRLGGRAIVAHPDSPDVRLRWRRSDVRYDGIEWLNADSEWRDDPTGRLFASTARAIVRPTATIVSLFGRPDTTLRRWDSMAASRSVPGLAAVDAHGGVLLGEDRGDRRGWTLAWPSYEATFRALSQHVLLEAPLTGQAAPDGAAILSALLSGRTYSVIDGYATPATLKFEAEQGDRRVGIGGDLPEAGLSTTFVASVSGAPGIRLVLIHNGAEIASGQGSLRHTSVALPGAYRVEAHFPGGLAPWIVSNHIGIGPREVEIAAPAATRPPPEELVQLPADNGWRTERSNDSEAAVGALADGTLTFTYRLGPSRETGPYAAIVRPVDRDRERGFDRIVLTGRASRPVRMSVQVRLPVGADGLRFRKSVYLDDTPRTVIVRLQDMQPVGATTQRPIVAAVQEMLMVLDTINSAPGSAGTISLSYVGLALGNTKGS